MRISGWNILFMSVEDWLLDDICIMMFYIVDTGGAEPGLLIMVAASAPHTRHPPTPAPTAPVETVLSWSGAGLVTGASVVVVAGLTPASIWLSSCPPVT